MDSGAASSAFRVSSVLCGHQRSVTCTALSSDGSVLYSGSKDCSIIRYDVEAEKRTGHWRGPRSVSHSSRSHPSKRRKKSSNKCHQGQVFAVALSACGRHLASGGVDGLVHIWDTRQDAIVKSFHMHRGPITCLAFAPGDGALLYSGSQDRTIQSWNVDSLAFVETLFGHTSQVQALCARSGERLLSCGSDRSVRFWKIPEEKHLIMEGHSASIDSVCFVDNAVFMAGSQDGALSLWNPRKDKPIFTVPCAHPCRTSSGGTEAGWISAVAGWRGTGLAASGSRNGIVQLWRVDTRRGRMNTCGHIDVPGVVNSLAFAQGGSMLVAGVGKEHRLGRWFRVKEGRNCVVICRQGEDVDEDEGVDEDDEDEDEDDDDDDEDEDEDDQ